MDANDLRLLSDSPCVDTGDNSAPGLPTTDIAGNPRVLDGNGDLNSIVDMGAYEYLPAGSSNSNAVDLEYMAILCANWLGGTVPEL
ncbi:MAG: choice-of-anchor Q domain-containing protein [Planctomycetota bacterium]